jgi:hypothetical protein
VYPKGYNTLRFTLRQTEEFQDWLDGLKDRRAQIRMVAGLRQAEAGNLGDWKPVGGAEHARPRAPMSMMLWYHRSRRAFPRPAWRGISNRDDYLAGAVAWLR